MEMDMSDTNNQAISSRRQFIVGGAVAAGSLVAVGGLSRPAAAAVAAVPAVPWEVPELDPDKVRDAGYFGYWADDPFKKQNYGCSYGVSGALIAEIRRVLGKASPWDTLPLEMFKWCKTGGGESGSLCGALAGAMPIFALAAPGEVTEMAADLMRWYQETALPSTEMDTLDPKRSYPNQPKIVAESVLCHVSSSKWCAAAKKMVSSMDRKTRCGKVTGDAAKMAAILLNRRTGGKKYVSVYTKTPEAYAECVKCHLDKPAAPGPDPKIVHSEPHVRLNNTHGLTNCKTCHPDAIAPKSDKKML
jgi:hypothetical protein